MEIAPGLQSYQHYRVFDEHAYLRREQAYFKK